ncbi:MAG: sulfite exporter TauE/SafE family protein [Desulfobacterales bacterium]|nr:sulfite exporter TauE/SafE family protein [Desulfobacterales bacterium]
MAPSSIDLTAMFLLGIFGTGHCIGMCGPLVVAFPGRSGGYRHHLAYHGGRLLTYTAIGAIMGAAGAGLGWIAGMTGSDPALWITRSQVMFSLAAAGFLLLFGLGRIGLVQEPRWLSIAEPQKIPGLGRLLRSGAAAETWRGLFVLGAMFGFLPCGLSFGAFARALGAGNMAAGALLTAAFGAGTLPGLLLVGGGASAAARRYRKHSDILSGMLMIALSLELTADAVQTLM